MKTSFDEFRYCDGDRKVERFAIIKYPNWCRRAVMRGIRGVLLICLASRSLIAFEPPPLGARPSKHKSGDGNPLKDEHRRKKAKVKGVLGLRTMKHEDPDPLDLAGAAMNTDADAVESAGVDAHEVGGALPVAGAIPGLAREPPASSLQAGLRKQLLQNPKRWSPRCSMARQGVGRKRRRKARPDMDTRGCQKKASASTSTRCHLGHYRRRVSTSGPE